MIRRVWIRLYAYWERIEFNWKVIFFIFAILIVSISIGLYYKKLLSKRKAVSIAGITIYLYLIFISTVISRPVMSNRVSNFNLIRTIMDRITYNIDTKLELIFNIFLLSPIGFFISLYDDRVRWKNVACLGMLVSLVIEICQFFTRRGIFELIDLIENTIGVLGYVFLKICVRVCRQINDMKMIDI